ncbi:1392_t:CDS:1, partial [Funneliformis geosporum]
NNDKNKNFNSDNYKNKVYNSDEFNADTDNDLPINNLYKESIQK